MRPDKKRVEINPEQQGLANLGSAFGNLNLNLPEVAAEKSQPLPAPVPETKPAAKRGRVLLRKETAHRGGKSVIVVHDFPTHLSLVQLEELGRNLRQAVGCGGTVRDRTIEIQGNQPLKIREFLQKQGFQVGGI